MSCWAVRCARFVAKAIPTMRPATIRPAPVRRTHVRMVASLLKRPWASAAIKSMSISYGEGVREDAIAPRRFLITRSPSF